MNIDTIVQSIKNERREERVPVSFKVSKTEFEALKAIALSNQTTVSKLLSTMVRSNLGLDKAE